MSAWSNPAFHHNHAVRTPVLPCVTALNSVPFNVFSGCPEPLMKTEVARTQMLGQQVRAWEVLDERVIDALGSVPRENFVPDGWRELAFADIPVPLAHGEEMMAPKVEGRLLQALRLLPDHHVLEVGTGTGFLAACLARLSGSVVSIDIHGDFIDAARARLAGLVGRVELQSADVFTYEPAAPFDAIAVTGALPVMDHRLLQWLKPGGRLFVVTGETPAMEASVWTRAAADHFTQESLFETVLTPLRNAPRPSAFSF